MTTATLFDYPATDSQRSYIRRLLIERDTTGTRYARSLPEVETEVLPRLTRQQASDAISALMDLPRAEAPAPVATDPTEDTCPNRPGYLAPGVYETGEGVFVVKPNRSGTHVYAKRLVEISGERATEAGQRMAMDFVYAPGACARLLPTDRMPYERARELTVRYGRCINCGRALRSAESVERGIGPVCRKTNGWC